MTVVSSSTVMTSWLPKFDPHLPHLPPLPPVMANMVPQRLYRPNARPVPGSGGSIRGAGSGGGAVLKREMTMSLTNKGLLNPTGENNCFLNSAVQVCLHHTGMAGFSCWFNWFVPRYCGTLMYSEGVSESTKVTRVWAKPVSSVHSR